MDSYYLALIILIIFSLLSAFFSGSETALFSLRKPDLHRFAGSHHRTERAINEAMRQPQNMLITILIGNLFVNLGASVFSTKLFLERFSEYGHIISIAVVTPLIILFCEISPKAVAISSYESFSRKVFPLLQFFHRLFFPLRLLLLGLTEMLIRVFHLRVEHDAITEDELGMAIHHGEEEGLIDKNESAFLKNVMVFAKKEAGNVMFHRNRATFIPYGATVDEAMKVILENNVIRAPVYKKDLDHVVGFVDSKDLMACYMGYRKARNINRFIQGIKFFPSTRELNDLLNDFLDKGIQIAILVDEYGGTDGVVTLNRLLAELMGEGFTRWEVDARPDVKRLSDSVIVVSGDMQIADFNATFKTEIDTTESETIGGYVIEQMARFPKKGEEVEVENYILRVRYKKKNHIESLELIDKRNSEESPAGEGNA